MRFSNQIRLSLVTTLAFVIVAGCSSGGSPSLISTETRSAQVRQSVPASWMRSEATSSALLYVSDVYNNDVDVYSWPQLSLVGTLTGLSSPGGECVDKAGNIWITNTGASQILKYAHGGTTPINTLSDPNEYPNGCSVDAKSGDLAVANIIGHHGAAGNVAIYTAASGSPTTYSDPNIPHVDFLTYNKTGSLFLDGSNNSGVFQMAKLKNGNFTQITIKGVTILGGGGVSLDDHVLSVGEQSGPSGYSIIYQITKNGTVTGMTPLLNSSDCIQYFIYGRRNTEKVICPNFGGQDVNIYKYPAGGAPIKTITISGSGPDGTAISP